MYFDCLSKYLNDIIILTDEKGNIKLANDKARSVYDYTQEEFYNLPGRYLRTPELRSEFDDFIKRVNSEKEIIY